MGQKAYPVCVRCGQPVKAPVGAPSRHVGHVDTELDQSCGVWAFKYRRTR